MHKIIALKLTACTDCTQKLHAYRYTYICWLFIYLYYIQKFEFCPQWLSIICIYIYAVYTYVYVSDV